MPTEPFSQMKDILLGYDTDIYFEKEDLMTTSGIDFMERELYKLLITLPGDWKADPTIGASPNKFTGEQNTRETAKEIEIYLEEGIRLTVFPGIPRIKVVPTSLESIMIFIDIHLPSFEVLTIPFEFDYINGIKRLIKRDSKVTPIISSKDYKINNIENLKRPNKYWSRMSYNSTN